MAIINLTRNNFKSEVMSSDKTVLIDFWAEWCGPCRMMSPVIDEIADEVNDVKVCKVNVDEASDLASMFGIESIPTLIVIKNGQTVNKSIGLISKEQVLSLINV
ncbi:MAG TPA: thioredoxin [Candidatus Eubacterium faecipullorum]|uniref:Thioredoxin n=1 Tax=Candidatus Eubacterium faecipullorum TaxID=2838571 RepID=A0A9D1RGH6_9FIRM|nr:thioredoxin [Candidatus Eubacterium faecipullorum]